MNNKNPEKLAMLSFDEKLKAAAIAILPPNPGPWTLTDDGKIIPVNSKHPGLDWIADIQCAPNGTRNLHVILASELMLRALKEINNDPASKRLGEKAKEALIEALTAAE